MVNGSHQGCEHSQVGAPGACQVGTRKAGLRSIGQKSGRLIADLVRLRKCSCPCYGEPNDERAALRLRLAQGKLPAFIRPPALGGAAGADDARYAAVGVQFIIGVYRYIVWVLTARRF